MPAKSGDRAATPDLAGRPHPSHHYEELTMITFVRTASIAPGKNGPAMAFAHDITSYMQKTYDREVEVLRPIGGNPNRIAWTSRYQDLAAFEAFQNKLNGDKAYWELLAKNSDCFLAGSVSDSFWATA
jgi:hypothetical protein